MCKSLRLLTLTMIIVYVIKTESTQEPNTQITTYRVKKNLLSTISVQPVFKSVTDISLWIVDVIPSILNYSVTALGSIPKLITDNIPFKLLEDLTDQYFTGINNEDIQLNITQLIQKYGYAVEEHQVQTSDEYLLNMFRIPGNGSACLLMHGLLSSADDWVTAGPNSGIAYLLASEGFDVWIGNARGNKHSKRHISLSPNEPEFWDFSWDEIGRYDLPALIDYIVNVTSQTKIKYIGHSQGTTAFFVMASEKPEYNNKISLMVALSAVAWMSHLKSPIVRLVSPVNPFLHSLLKVIGVYEFLPNNIVIKIFQNIFCGTRELAQIVCSNIVFILCGFDYDQLNVTNLPVFFSHVPSGAATKQLVHYGQNVISGQFQKYDHGKNINEKKYGSQTPPAYPVHKIDAPVAIFYSDEDWLADKADVEILRQQLKNVVEYYRIPNKKFNHLDFIWAKDIKKYVFDKIIQLFEKY